MEYTLSSYLFYYKIEISVFPDANPVHHAKDIRSFPGICKVMDMFNARFNASNDSCLILKYTSSSTSTSLHADDEDNLDDSEPICNLTVGTSRVIKFVSKSGQREVCRIEMKDKGVVVMRPGTQTSMLHTVPGDGKRTKTLRFSLSFRTLAKRSNLTPTPALTSAPVTVTSSDQCNPQIQPVTATSSPLQTEATPKTTRHVCLIAGDSYAARLESEKLGKNRIIVENIARGGAQLHHVIGQLKAYAAANGSTVVDKVLVSVGTNDIRYCQNVGELRPKLKSLCSYINELFPCSKVYFQLLIPLPCKHDNDWITNRKVLDFNRIIINECIFRKFHTLDAFSVFCSPYYHPRYPHLRNNRLFNGSDIHPSKLRGLGALARVYLRALHSQYFDPFTLQ